MPAFSYIEAIGNPQTGTSFEDFLVSVADASRKCMPGARGGTGRRVPQNSETSLIDVMLEFSQGGWRNWQTR